MAVLGLWLRVELALRWRTLLVLAVLVALTATAVLAAAAGARRTASAVDRSLEATLPADVLVYFADDGFDWDQVRAMPHVAAVATTTYGEGVIEGVPDEVSAIAFFPLDDQFGTTVERPVVTAGRPADPAAADEVVVTERFVAAAGLGVGDALRVDLHEQFASFNQEEPPADPVRVTVEIVGVVRPLWSLDRLDSTVDVFPTPALFDAHRDHLIGADETLFADALVRFAGGAADAAEFRAALAELDGTADVEVDGSAGSVGYARDVAGFEAAWLAAFAAAALLAGTVLVGLTALRCATATNRDLDALRGVGLVGRRRLLLAAAGPAVAATAGVGVGIVGAVAVSAAVPFGSAAAYEPAPGLDVDPLVIVVGAVVFPLVVLAATVAATMLGRRARPRRVRSTVVAACAGVGVAVPVVIGARFALERGPEGAPVRPAILGAVTGVLGVLAALTFSAGLTDAAEHPELFGQNYSGWANFGYGFASTDSELVPAEAMVAALKADPDVTGLYETRYSLGTAGGVAVWVHSYEPVKPTLPIVLTAGDAPGGADEVALVPTTARRLGIGIGDTVTLAGNAGSRSLRVTGLGLILEGPEPEDHTNGAWVTAAGYDALFTGFSGHDAMYVLRPDLDPAVGAALLTERLGALPENSEFGFENVFTPEPPLRLEEIRAVQVLPVVLAAFLTVLALGAVGNALGTAVRRRAGDIAALRALGMTRLQCRLVVLTHAGILAGVGLLVGGPLGVAVGRTAWRVVADLTPLLYRPPDVLGPALTVVAVTVLAVTVLAAQPGRRAARLDAGRLLRSE